MGANDLGEFLASRRARLTPADIGITAPTTSTRRVKGLRREEVASRAGVSIEYYVRIEQGKARRPSDEVLRALARALNLSDPETRYLLGLARTTGPKMPAVEVRPALQSMLDAMPELPAMIYNHRLDILAWSPLVAELFFDVGSAPPGARNLAMFGFCDPESKQRFGQWDEVGRATVGQLRLAAAQYPQDEALATLIGHLMISSSRFAQFWNAGEVALRTHGHKAFRHPAIGELTLAYDTFDLPCHTVDDHGQLSQRMVIFHPTSAEAADALKLVGMWRSQDAAAQRER